MRRDEVKEAIAAMEVAPGGAMKQSKRLRRRSRTGLQWRSPPEGR